jgi:hypothetical protein
MIRTGQMRFRSDLELFELRIKPSEGANTHQQHQITVSTFSFIYWSFTDITPNQACLDQSYHLSIYQSSTSSPGQYCLPSVHTTYAIRIFMECMNSIPATCVRAITIYLGSGFRKHTIEGQTTWCTKAITNFPRLRSDTEVCTTSSGEIEVVCS